MCRWEVEVFDKIAGKSVLINVVCRGAKIKKDWVNLPLIVNTAYILYVCIGDTIYIYCIYIRNTAYCVDNRVYMLYVYIGDTVYIYSISITNTAYCVENIVYMLYVYIGDTVYIYI